MSTVTDNDLKELKDLINNRLDRFETKIDNLESNYISLEKSVSNIETKIDRLETKIDNLESNYISLDKSVSNIETKVNTMKPVFDKILDLSEKIGEYKNWKQISIILLTGFLTSFFWIFRNTPNL
ncbi:hypothetical protein [Geminocystis herdmanii]|uniref:hypothetical protein n=1 Tax=Geminocystis herdmanii TaxID=669359 RepID=UPI00034D2250|nr:hypothetical protein [Geminocystis herdmanii]